MKIINVKKCGECPFVEVINGCMLVCTRQGGKAIKDEKSNMIGFTDIATDPECPLEEYGNKDIKPDNECPLQDKENK